MKYEKSCGAVVFTKNKDGIRYVIVQSLEGFHGFPKGHMESGETEEETALREIFEETGLKPKLLKGFKTKDEHPISDDIIKQIIYFIAEYREQSTKIQTEELMKIDLMDFDEAMDTFEFESSKRILKEANDFLTR